MKAEGWRDFIWRLATGRFTFDVRGGWLRVRQWTRDFTPGLMCCVICGVCLALLSIGGVQWSAYRQHATLTQAMDDEQLLTQMQTATLRDLRAAGWRQGSAAMTLPLPAQAMLTTALASLASRAREEDALIVSTEAWAGLSWLNHAAESHGLAVEHLQGVDSPLSQVLTEGSELPADFPSAPAALSGPWLSFDIRLAGTRQALAGFLDTLGATAGAVRAVHFTISAESTAGVTAAQGDLRLQVQSTRLSLPDLPEQAMAVLPSQQQAPAAGQAALWRDGYMTAWHRLPDGEVVRTASVPDTDTALVANSPGANNSPGAHDSPDACKQREPSHDRSQSRQRCSSRPINNDAMHIIRANKAPTGEATSQ